MIRLKDCAFAAPVTFFAVAVLGFFASLGLFVLVVGSVGAATAWIATAFATKRANFDLQAGR